MAFILRHLCVLSILLPCVLGLGTQLTFREYERISELLIKEIEKRQSDGEYSDTVTQVMKDNLTIYHRGDESQPVFLSSDKDVEGKPVIVIKRGEDYLLPEDKQTFIVLKQKSGSEYNVHIAVVYEMGRDHDIVVWGDARIEQQAKVLGVLNVVGSRYLPRRRSSDKRPRCEWVASILLCNAKTTVPAPTRNYPSPPETFTPPKRPDGDEDDGGGDEDSDENSDFNWPVEGNKPLKDKNTGSDTNKNAGGGSNKNSGGGSNKNTGGGSNNNTGGGSNKNTGGGSNKNTGGGSNKNTGGGSNKNTGGGKDKDSGGSKDEDEGSGKDNDNNGGGTESGGGSDADSSNAGTGGESDSGQGEGSDSGKGGESDNATGDGSDTGDSDASKSDKENDSKRSEERYILVKGGSKAMGKGRSAKGKSSKGAKVKPMGKSAKKGKGTRSSSSITLNKRKAKANESK